MEGVTRIYDCSQTPELLEGLRVARGAIARGELVVIPTDTVYGVAADAFSPEAVQRLLDAKGRGRDAPPPVLVSGPETLEALASEVPPPVRWLVEAFWPGGLTIILPARSTLTWDLGDTGGTVAVRCPDHPIARELLAETGPLAVSSANTTGDPAATTAAAALEMLGESVAATLDAGEVGQDLEPAVGDDGRVQNGSTIIDATTWKRGEGKLRIVRQGVISRARIAEVLGAALAPVETEPDTSS